MEIIWPEVFHYVIDYTCPTWLPYRIFQLLEDVSFPVPFVCPKINIFWRKVYSELITIFGTDITFNWDEHLFGLVHSALEY